VAFTKPEDFVDRIRGSHLGSDHPACSGADICLVGRVEQLAIPPVAGALL